MSYCRRLLYLLYDRTFVPRSRYEVGVFSSLSCQIMRSNFVYLSTSPGVISTMKSSTGKLATFKSVLAGKSLP